MQHISWSQGCSTSLYNSEPISWTFTPSVNHTWQSGIFWISSITGIKAISGLVPIHLYFKKLYGRFLLRGSSLPPNHIISSILSSDGLHKYNSYNISIDNLTPKQKLCLKSTLIDMDNSCNKIFPSFSVFNDKEFSLGSRLIDSFQINFLSIHILWISKSTSKTWIILYLEHHQTLLLPLSYLTPVLRTM